MPTWRRSVVAIDPTSRGVAFVFFENGVLLDWGERLPSRDAGELVCIVERLLVRCAAEVLVLEDAEAEGCHRRPRIRRLLRAIAEHAHGRGIEVIAVPRMDVQHAWKTRGASNKEAVAAAIGMSLPELSSIVPPQRKAGHNEDSRVNVFDAASLALHAFDSVPIGH